ncbi:MAG: 50S ribosomal protein L21 [Cryomorphaceae bacterium]|nr:50S ribosomal protein L21 [Flavobacteriales bacterium]
MYAVVNIAGQQFKVQKDQHLFVHRLSGKEGDKITLGEVLLVDNDGKISVGAPAVEGASITAKVVEHLKGDKVIVFKKKRRKGYQTRNGHRQQFTKIAIEGISLNGAAEKKAKAEPKKEAKAEPKAESKAEPKAEVKAAPKAEPKKEAKAEAKPEAKPSKAEETKPKASDKGNDTPTS